MKTRSHENDRSDSGKRDTPALLALYSACITNAEDLLEEAELLLSKGHAARALALAYTSLEEVGKTHLVADYVTDVVSLSEFRRAFSDHNLKAAYFRRWATLPDGIIEYDTEGAKTGFLERNAALYVGLGPEFTAETPSQAITPEYAEEVIRSVQVLLHEMASAEWMNGRIGSRGLFK